MDQPDANTPPTGRSAASILLPTLAAISVLLCLPPLATHIKSRNVAAAILVFWISLDNLFNFINPLIWPTDDDQTWWSGHGLCDIEVKLNLASSAAIPGGLICIFRQLAVILDTDRTTLAPSRGQQRRRLAFEIFFCAVCPLYMMVVHFIVQPYRYYIFAISGCVPSFDNSWPGILLIFIPPLILCATAAGYCGLVIFRLLRYRQQFSDILASSQSKLNKSRFLRLFVLSTTLIVIFLPIAIYVFSRNLGYPRHSFSWSTVHGPEWSTFIFTVQTQGTVNFDRWLNVGIGYAVFLFGFGSEATMMYRSWLLKLGFGHCFPKLNHPHLAPNSRGGSSARTSNATKIGSMSSCARLIFYRKQSGKIVFSRYSHITSLSGTDTSS
jgi:pheromone a factor receptor